MASYDWIDLEDGQGYDQLLNVLDPEFDPRGIAASLKSQVTDAAKGVLVEHGYVDKDYRSTFYNFYAKKGRHYRSDCVRLHFFNGAVWHDEERTDIACNDGRPQDHYFGYIVLRPTIVATLGRSVLSPNIRLGASGRAIQSVHFVNLLGHRLPIWGFPSMAQHVDIAVCAHVSCWAILRYYSETFAHHREYLVHDITKLAAPFDPGGLVPSLGFNVLGAERVFQAAGCFPVLVGKRNSSSEAAFFSQLLAYLESGFPLFVAMPGEKHAVVIVGYSWRQSAAAPSGVLFARFRSIRPPSCQGRRPRVRIPAVRRDARREACRRDRWIQLAAIGRGSRAVVIARVAAGGDAPGRRRQPPSL